jgi:hypothetical protein
VWQLRGHVPPGEDRSGEGRRDRDIHRHRKKRARGADLRRSASDESPRAADPGRSVLSGSGPRAGSRTGRPRRFGSPRRWARSGREHGAVVRDTLAERVGAHPPSACLGARPFSGERGRVHRGCPRVKRVTMNLMPQLTGIYAATVAACLLMVVLGVQKRLLAWRHQSWRCPSCGRLAKGRVCEFCDRAARG